MTLDVFDIKLGPDAKMPLLDPDNTGLVAVQLLDAIQTVVDVLTDNDGGKGWQVGFDPTVNAYTDRSAKRQIVVSVKPFLDAKPGESLSKVAAIMTGFTVHEIGHTKLNFATAIAKRWPNKRLPQTLGNIIEDVVLELRTVERYPGFADHGNGNIFRPTLEWVAELTCPKTPLEWKGSTGHRVNVVGQVIRYKEFVTFGNDAATQAAVNFVEKWGEGITSGLTPAGCVTLIEQMLDYLKATNEEEAPPPDEPPLDPPDFPKGNTGQTIVDEDDDTEGDDGKGEGDDGDGDDTEGEGEGNGDGEPGDGEGEGEDADGEAEDGEGEGEGPGKGDGNDADTLNRTAAPKGANDSKGKGGSGQAVAEAGDEGDPDEGFDEADLDDTFDDVATPDKGYQQREVAAAEADERVTTRMDAGAHGKMRVIFR